LGTRIPVISSVGRLQVIKPFDCHQLPYMEIITLRIARIMHAMQDLPKRLPENPEG
jgi:hypothetical protein